jgi:hypothetical protein
MQHGHVKRKEKHMNRYVMEEFYQDPQLRRRLFAEAHRDRARMVSAGLAWLWNHAKALAGPRWIARLG